MSNHTIYSMKIQFNVLPMFLKKYSMWFHLILKGKYLILQNNTSNVECWLFLQSKSGKYHWQIHWFAECIFVNCQQHRKCKGIMEECKNKSLSTGSGHEDGSVLLVSKGTFQGSWCVAPLQLKTITLDFIQLPTYYRFQTMWCLQV